MTEAVEVQDFGVYKDVNENYVYFRDIEANRPLSPPFFTYGPLVRHNFRVYRGNSSISLYDVLICSKNGYPSTADNCTLLQVNTVRKSATSVISY